MKLYFSAFFIFLSFIGNTEKLIKNIIFEKFEIIKIPEYEKSLDIKKTIVAYKGKEEVNLDGKIEENFWEGKEEYSKFCLLGTYDSFNEQTKFYIGWTEENLYIFLRCESKDIKKINFMKGGRDTDIWIGESVEIFIDPGHTEKEYYQLVVNPAEVIWDGKKESAGINKDWNGNWEYKSYVGENFWTAEIKIPFKTLGKKPNVGEIWGINFTRNDTISGISQWSSHYPIKSNHVPERFGHLIFIDPEYKTNYVLITDVIIPEKTYIGENEVFLRIKNIGNKKENILLNIILENEKLKEEKIILKEKEEIIKKTSFFIKEIDEKDIFFVLKKDGEIISQCKKNINVIPIMSFTKSSFFLNEDIKGEFNLLLSNIKAKIILKDEKGKVINGQEILLKEGKGKFIINGRNLKEDIYNLEMEIDYKGKKIKDTLKFTKERGPFEF